MKKIRKIHRALACFIILLMLAAAMGISPIVRAQEPVLPENAVSVWDMEALPDSPGEAGWAADSYPDHGGMAQGNIVLSGEDGKGYENSRALAWTFANLGNHWANEVVFSLVSDGAAHRDWSEGKILWLWLDGSQTQASLNMRISINGISLGEGAAYSTWNGEAFEEHSCDGYGNMVLPGYKGWLQIPLEGYSGLNLANIEKIGFYAEPWNETLPLTLYVDAFHIEGEESEPITDNTPLPAKLETAWDMEALPDDLYAAGWTADANASVGGIGKGFISMHGADGMGYNGSRALKWTYIGPMEGGSYWGQEVRINLKKDESTIYDWQDADELWFWIDASRLASSMSFELTINGAKGKEGSEYRTWNGESFVADRLNQYGRMSLAGYKGWVCLPLASWEQAGLTSVEWLGFYTEPWGESLPADIYLDQFSLLTIPKAPPPEDLIVAWDMEALPDNLAAAGWAVDAYPDYGGVNKGNVGFYTEPGGGYLGSGALKWTFEKMGDNYWANEVRVSLEKDESAKRDWSRGDTLWFWVDASAFAGNADIQLSINGTSPAGGSMFTIWTGEDYEQRSVNQWGRMPLAGYKGWVSIAFSAYGGVDFSDIKQIGFYTEPWNEQLPADILFDQLGFTGPEPEDGGLINEGVPLGENLLYTDVGKTYQKVKAFGASGAWWSTGIGGRENIDELLELLFTEEGIGLNNYRHNIGGGKAEGPAGDDWRSVPTPLMPDGSINIGADAAAHNVLEKLSALGTIDELTMFINSPPASMTVNGKTYSDTGESNLRPECYEEFAVYVADVAEAYLNAGIKLKYISPINEPQWPWNSGWQEGCHYSPEEVLTVGRLVIEEIERRELPVIVSLPETTKWIDRDYTMGIYEAMMNDPVIRAHTDHFSGHSYNSNAAQKKGLSRYLSSYGDKALPLHQTEWGPSMSEPSLGMATAVELGRVVYEDLSILNAESWSWWLGISKYNYSDGLIYVNTSNESYQLSKRFWALGNYSRFIKGYTRVEADETLLPKMVYASAYISPDNNEIVYVLVNESQEEQHIGFAGMPDSCEGMVYETSAKRDISAARGSAQSQYGYILPAQSISTFVFPTTDITPPENGGGEEPVEPEQPYIIHREEVFGFEGMETGFLVRPEDHEDPAEIFLEDPSHNGGWGNEANFALNKLYTAKISSDSGVNNSQGLEWTCLTSGGTSELVFNLPVIESAICDWSGAKALEFYIDLSDYGNYDVDFYFRMTERDKMDGKNKAEVWTLNGNGSVYIDDGFGSLSEVYMYGDWFTLPAGYEGWVQIRLSEESLMPVTWQAPVSGELELAEVERIWFGISNPPAAKGKTAIIDSFTILRHSPAHTVSVNVAEGYGSILADKNLVENNGVVTISIQPADGYELDKIMINGKVYIGADCEFDLLINEKTSIEAYFAKKKGTDDSSSSSSQDSSSSSSQDSSSSSSQDSSSSSSQSGSSGAGKDTGQNWRESAGKKAMVSLSYNLNYSGGGNIKVDSGIEKGSSIIVSDNVPGRSGYRFIGWNTRTDGEGSSYSTGEVLLLEGDVVLYAQWEPDELPAKGSTASDNDGEQAEEPTSEGQESGSLSQTEIFAPSSPPLSQKSGEKNIIIPILSVAGVLLLCGAGVLVYYIRRRRRE